MCCTRAQDTQSVSHAAVFPLCWQLKLKGTNPLRPWPKEVVPHKHGLISAYFIVQAAQNKWRISALDAPTVLSLFLRKAKTWTLLGNPHVKTSNNNPADSQVKDWPFLSILHPFGPFMTVRLPHVSASPLFSAGCIFRSGQSFRRVLQRPGHRAQWHHRWPGPPSANTKVQEIFNPRPGTPVRYLKSAQLLNVVLFV